jgi:hypothetical protein
MYESYLWTIVTNVVLCWITSILVALGLVEILRDFVDYRSYMGSSLRIWSFRRLFLNLCSYNLDGSVTNMINNDMIHLISSHDRIGSSILTSLAPHVCIGSSTPSLAQASPSHAVPRFKASDLPFTLATSPSSQVMSWSSPPWSHDSMSCLLCNKLLHHHMCKLCNISKPFPPPWHMLLTHMYLWTNHLCISHKT